MSIKKAYQAVVDLLEANPNKTVKQVLPEVIELCSAKAGGGGRTSKQVVLGADGKPTHIFCYYHKKWEPVGEVEFGTKAKSATGLSNMCKEGTSNWTKQNRELKARKSELLDLVTEGELDPKDLKKEIEKAEAAAKKIIPREDGIGADEMPEAK